MPRYACLGQNGTEYLEGESIVSTDISSAASALSATLPTTKPDTSDASTQSSRTLEQSELSLSLNQYRAELGDDQSSNALRALANQITTDARALGEAIAIPTVPNETTTFTATAPVAASSHSALDTLV
jgi:hypothetical protein